MHQAKSKSGSAVRNGQQVPGDRVDTAGASFPQPKKVKQTHPAPAGHKPKEAGRMVVQSPSTNFAKGKHGHLGKANTPKGAQIT